VESRDERMARAVWEESAKLGGLPLDVAENLSVPAAKDASWPMAAMN
jgi:hypothetical protein